jgi:OOP family OmpA-OmpF porin
MFNQIAIAAVLAVAASTAAAQSPAFYIGADVGQSKIDDIGGQEGSYGIFAGYKINETFAIEANYRRLNDFDTTAFGPNLNFKTDQIGLSAIAALPLSNNFSLYGRLGYNRLDIQTSSAITSVDSDDSGVLYGVGVGYDFSPTMSARLEYQRPASDMSNISAGVSFKF